MFFGINIRSKEVTMFKISMYLSLMMLITVFTTYAQGQDKFSLVDLKIGVIKGISMDKETFLILDSKTKEIIRYDYTKKVIVKRIKLEVMNPSGIVFDGSNFWTIEKNENSIKQLDGKTGKILNTLRPD